LWLKFYGTVHVTVSVLSFVGVFLVYLCTAKTVTLLTYVICTLSLTTWAT